MEGGSEGFISLTPQMIEDRSSGGSSVCDPWAGPLEGLPIPVKDKLLAMREERCVCVCVCMICLHTHVFLVCFRVHVFQ